MRYLYRSYCLKEGGVWLGQKKGRGDGKLLIREEQKTREGEKST